MTEPNYFPDAAAQHLCETAPLEVGFSHTFSHNADGPGIPAPKSLLWVDAADPKAGDVCAQEKRGSAHFRTDPLLPFPHRSDEIFFRHLFDRQDGFDDHFGAFEKICDLLSVLRLPTAGYAPGLLIHISSLHLQVFRFRRPAGFQDLHSRLLHLRFGHGRHTDEKCGHTSSLL